MSYINGEDKNVIISKSRLLHLLNCELELEALQAGGVDNWGYYSDSFKDMVDMILEDEGKTREEVGEDYCLYDIAEERLKDYEEVK